jgi:N-terminal acetyltransferase B complex non-catalytic subunit
LTAKHGFRCTCCTYDCQSYCQSCLAKLCEESIESYQAAVSDDGRITKSLLPTDRHPADDLCILAAMCLTKLGLSKTSPEHEHLDNPRTTYLLQATVLLESAWSRSKSNFQISLMLVRLYSYLGCGSLAMRAYQRLYLKQIQLDTLSYVMFDRISSLHPHPISDSSDGSSKTRSIIEQLQKQQKLYKTSREHINKNTWLSFKHGSYNSILEFREVTQKLSHSMSATMSVLESNKIHRLTTNTIAANGITQMYDLIRKPNDSIYT